MLFKIPVLLSGKILFPNLWYNAYDFLNISHVFHQINSILPLMNSFDCFVFCDQHISCWFYFRFGFYMIEIMHLKIVFILMQCQFQSDFDRLLVREENISVYYRISVRHIASVVFLLHKNLFFHHIISNVAEKQHILEMNN